MLRRTANQKFLNNFISGWNSSFSNYSKNFTGKGNSNGTNFNIPNFFGGSPGSFGGPLGGFFDKALEWCSISHAHSIANSLNINLRNIQFNKTPEGGVNVMVDAPTATPLQIEELGRRVQEECPVARFRQTHIKSKQQEMKWLKLPEKEFAKSVSR